MEAKKNRLKKRRPRIRGICTAAMALGVSRVHLHKVLVGERRSQSLTQRYQEWQRSNGVES
jgi:hypothetical protein